MSNPSERSIQLAYHEAGHAVAAIVLGRGVLRATIVPEPPHYSGCVVYATAPSVEQLRSEPEKMDVQIMLNLAGPIAQARAAGRRLRADQNEWADEDDYIDAVGFITGIDNPLSLVVEGGSEGLRAAMGPEIASRMDSLVEQTDQLITEHWPQVDAVAQALVIARTLSGDEIAHLLELEG